MATNEIYFNNEAVPITLNGIYWNGTKIEGCKGINLNGTVVVSFETVLNWSDYTAAYNSVWTSNDTTVEPNVSVVIISLEYLSLIIWSVLLATNNI